MYGEWLSAVGDFNGDGALNAVLIVEETESALAGAQMIGASLTEAGIGFDVLEVTLPRQDFSSTIARIVVRDQAPDAIFVRFNGESAAALQRQLAVNGIGPDRSSLIIATRQALASEHYWPLVGESGAFTVVGRVGPWTSAVSERGAAFAGAYAAWMQRWPEGTAFLAYDALYLLRDAVVDAGSVQAADLLKALERTELAGASGRIAFDVTSATPPTAQGDGPPDWAWHQWLETPRLFMQYTEAGQPAANMAVIWPASAATVDGPVVRPPAAE
jgi:branched-chain amino acid transport system substrate-binding protein